MRILTGSNISELYKNALEALVYDGLYTKPRGYVCHEISPCTLVLDYPDRNILDDNVRCINKAFAAAELCWILAGRNDLEFIQKFNSNIANYSDNGKIFFGAYGPKFVQQLPYVLKTMKKDPYTRQAIMTIWRESPPKTKDVPCTIALHFIQRPIGTLNLVVYMRSNDVWLGLPYDIHNFTCIQMIIASMLGLSLGKYTHIDGSLHLYEQHDELAIKCKNELKSGHFKSTAETLIKTPYELYKQLGWMYDKKAEATDPMIRQKIEVMKQYLRKKCLPE